MFPQSAPVERKLYPPTESPTETLFCQSDQGGMEFNGNGGENRSACQRPGSPAPGGHATPARHPATRATRHLAYRLRPSRTSATQARATWKSLSLVPATTVTGRASRRG